MQSAQLLYAGPSRTRPVDSPLIGSYARKKAPWSSNGASLESGYYLGAEPTPVGDFSRAARRVYGRAERARQVTTPGPGTPTTANMADTVTGDDRASANLAVKEVSVTAVTGAPFARKLTVFSPPPAAIRAFLPQSCSDRDTLWRSKAEQPTSTWQPGLCGWGIEECMTTPRRVNWPTSLSLGTFRFLSSSPLVHSWLS